MPVDPPIKTISSRVFVATDLEQGEQELESGEAGMRVSYVSSDELRALIRDGGIKDAPTVAAYALLQLQPESAAS